MDLKFDGLKFPSHDPEGDPVKIIKNACAKRLCFT